MAMGVPVVSHNIGFNGLNIQSGEGAVLASTMDEFAQCCIALLESESQRRTIGETGKRVVSEQFDWNSITSRLENYLLEIQQINQKQHHG